LNKPSFPVYKDRTGEIWFGSNNAFCRYNKSTKKFFEYPYPVITQNFPYKSLQAIYQDFNGIFWLGTTAGLLRFDPARKSWKQFKNNPQDSTSLSFDLIFCLCADPIQPNRYLWIGTSGGGVNCFDVKSEKVTRYSMRDGLANDVVYGILSDNNGSLWMSTNNGLSKFDSERKNFHNYNVNDGLQGNEFNRYAFCKTKDGILFFGGVNGFNYFDPAELNDSSTMPNVMITDFRIKNQPVSFQSKNSSLSKPVYLTDKITLPYRDNMISFDFVSFDFTNPGKNLYKYRLEGFDRDWVSSGTQHSATYTNLDPGTYTLKISASNGDGVWNENGRSLQLVILPPWYMTWWFRLTVVIVIVTAAYWFYRYRINQTLKLQAVRNRIASDLHDEIGSNLSNISIFSNVAQQNENNSATASMLQRITEYTQLSMEAMSDIVWMINTRNDRFENIMVRMRTLAAEIFEATNWRLHMQFDEKLYNLNMNMEERKNFYLIYKEAINNIAKYAECKDVWISMALDHSKILLEIKDNGKGFDVENIGEGNGLVNMKKRAEMLKGKLTITSKRGEGTLVRLSFQL
jgi:two-component sensor histidine kinase